MAQGITGLGTDERLGDSSTILGQKIRMKDPRGPPGGALLLYEFRWYAIRRSLWGKQVRGT